MVFLTQLCQNLPQYSQFKSLPMYTAPSQIAQRQIAYFEDKKILIMGEIEDNFAHELSQTATSVDILCSNYLHYQNLRTNSAVTCHFGVQPPADLDVDTLLLYWPKAKAEANMLLAMALPLLTGDKEVCVVGENRSGIKSIEKMFTPYGIINKYDSARRCSFYWGRCTQTIAPFNLDDYITSFEINCANTVLNIKSLPGVFNHGKLDVGTQLLLQHLPTFKGEILDIGCGAGVIGAFIGKQNPNIKLTMTDVSAFAIESTKRTLEANQLMGKVFASNVYSDIQGKFDAIVSNPPFHSGLETDYQAAETLLGDAPKYLNASGEIWIVANSFLKYPPIIESAFGKCELVDKTNKFAVYWAKK